MKELKVGITYNTSDNDLEEEFYRPCLQWAVNFDRGVGYFTSGWIKRNSAGLSDFAGRGGHTRWIISPILNCNDFEVITSEKTEEEKYSYLRKLLIEDIHQLELEMQQDTLNVFAWMLFDGILEIRFAIPKRKLEDGDFHDKFGIFTDIEGNQVSFLGSVNDTQKGFHNYESIKVFKSWVSGVKEYVEEDVKRFDRLWDNRDFNVDIYTPDEAVKQQIFQLRKGKRPYKLKKDKWHHQQEAMDAFFRNKHGILEMATGTGKTRTALRIIDTLLKKDRISNCIIVVYGNDLLDQWYKEVIRQIKEVLIFRYYGKYKELSDFLLWKKKGILLLARESEWLKDCLLRLEDYKKAEDVRKRTLLLFDEVHGMGAPALRSKLTGIIEPYQYRLGLSATPEREFDEAGNRFIENEIGPTIYKFGLEQAIEKGILCEFSYHPIEYELLESEKQQKRDIIARYEVMKKKKISFDENEMYRDLADVNKLSEAKLPLFREYIRSNPNVLEQCLIFVANKEYGEKVQQILLEYMYEYHTYYSEDRKENLLKFAAGDLKCLITCKKISEGVDIQSVKNIILFSSDKGKLVTTQRIGRSLRLNEKDPDKKALVVDFICVNSKDTLADGTDQERRKWLSELAQIRRKIL